MRGSGVRISLAAPIISIVTKEYASIFEKPSVYVWYLVNVVECPARRASKDLETTRLKT
jgi:hypothetical protein